METPFTPYDYRKHSFKTWEEKVDEEVKQLYNDLLVLNAILYYKVGLKVK